MSTAKGHSEEETAGAVSRDPARLFEDCRLSYLRRFCVQCCGVTPGGRKRGCSGFVEKSQARSRGVKSAGVEIGALALLGD